MDNHDDKLYSDRVAKLCAAIQAACQPPSTVSLGHQSMRALQQVADHPGGVGDVAAALSLAPNSASEIVRRLAQRGLISKRRSTADERVVELRITPAGARLVEEQTLLDRAKLAARISGLSATERRTILWSLERLAALLQD